MAKAKPKKHPRITTALAHYEAALAILQQELCTVDRETLEAINDAYVKGPDVAIPGALTFTHVVHDAGDVFRIAKQVLDPARTLPSSTPKLEDVA